MSVHVGYRYLTRGVKILTRDEGEISLYYMDRLTTDCFLFNCLRFSIKSPKTWIIELFSRRNYIISGFTGVFIE